jgi:hypothetical protein
MPHPVKLGLKGDIVGQFEMGDESVHLQGIAVEEHEFLVL